MQTGRRQPSKLIWYCYLVVIAALMAACHQNDVDSAPRAEAPKAAVATTQVSPAIPAVPPAVRAKPDFGGVTTEHVEISATGQTLEVAVDNAVRLAVEQVNGKVVVSGTVAVDAGAALTSNGQHLDVQSSGFAQWLTTRTSGAVTHFRILSQEQVSKPLSSDEERLDVTKGESWNKGKFDASESVDVSASGKFQASASTRADDVGEADASARNEERLSGSHEVEASGQWDRHDGAQSVDYQKRHTEYAHGWRVTIAADVAKYSEAANAGFTRVVVTLPRAAQLTFRVGDANIPAEVVASQIRRELTDALTQTHRFTVLDRDADEEINREINLIRSGNANPADTARLGRQLATDLIVIPTIDRFEYLRHERALRLSDRTLVSYTGGGALSFRLVNATTGQVVMSQSFQYQLPATAPTTLGASADGSVLASLMMDALGEHIASTILRSTFPLSVIQQQGRSIVINQGGEAVTAGAIYQVVTMGKELIDPQSGQSLGPTERPCCTAQIDRVTPTMSYGHILETGVTLGDPFVPGSMELREEVQPSAKKPTASSRIAQHHPPATARRSGEKPLVVDTDSNW